GKTGNASVASNFNKRLRRVCETERRRPTHGADYPARPAPGVTAQAAKFHWAEDSPYPTRRNATAGNDNCPSRRVERWRQEGSFAVTRSADVGRMDPTLGRGDRLGHAPLTLHHQLVERSEVCLGG